jgi:WD40 repeat protein
MSTVLPNRIMSLTLCMVGLLFSVSQSVVVTATRDYEVHVQQHNLDFAFSPDGMYLYSAGHDHVIRKWNLSTGELVQIMEHWDTGNMSPIPSISIDTTRNILASISHDETTMLWDGATGDLLARFEVAGILHANELSQDSLLYIAKGFRDPLLVFDVSDPANPTPTGPVFDEFERILFRNSRMAIHDEIIVVSTLDEGVFVWNSVTGDSLYSLKPSTGSRRIYDVEISPDGSRMATAHGTSIESGSWRGAVNIWDVTTGDSIGAIVPVNGGSHNASISDVIYTPDGQYLLGIGEQIYVWDATTGDSVGVIGPFGSMSSPSVWFNSQVGLSPDGRYLATPGVDNNAAIAVWDISTGELVREMTSHLARSPAAGTWLSATGDSLFMESETGGISIRDLATGDTISVARGPDNLHGLTFYADQNIALIPRPYDDTDQLRYPVVSAYDMVTGEFVASYSVDDSSTIERAWVTGSGQYVVAFGSALPPPNYNYLADAVFLWDRETGILETTIFIADFGFAQIDEIHPIPNSDRLVVEAKVHHNASQYRELVVLDLATGDSLHATWFESSIGAVEISGDGSSILLSSYTDKEGAALIDAETGEFQHSLVSDLHGHPGQFALSEDGSYAVLGFGNSEWAEIYRTDTGALVESIHLIERPPNAPPSMRNYSLREIIVTDGGSKIVIQNDQSLQVWSVSPSLTWASLVSVRSENPVRATLNQNVPNPFNPTTSISFKLDAHSTVRVNVYNTAGQLVREIVNDALPAGTHSVVWDGCDASGRSVASGVYLYRLATDKHSFVRRMTLLR